MKRWWALLSASVIFTAPAFYTGICGTRRGAPNQGNRRIHRRRRGSRWRGGLMPIAPEKARRYPSDWGLRRRFIVEYRAGGRCEWCGAVNYQPHPDTGSKVVLTLAHVWDKRPGAGVAAEPGGIVPALPPQLGSARAHRQPVAKSDRATDAPRADSAVPVARRLTGHGPLRTS